MKLFPSVLSLVLLATVADAQVQQAWVRTYNAPGNGNDTALANAVDASGNVYVTGSSRAWPDPSGGDFEFATVKYDPSGNELWVARYDGPGVGTNQNDTAVAIALDGVGNVYVTGHSASAIGSPDYATVKYDSVGNQVWASRYDGTGHASDSPVAIAVDGSGNVFVTGSSYVPTPAGLFLDYVTIKYDSAGAVIWLANYDGPSAGDDSATALVVDPSGSVFVTGYSRGTGEEYATVKYDSNGVELWSARYGAGFGGFNRATALALDPAGNVFVTGYSTGATGNPDYATLKYDPTGLPLWLKRYNGPADEDDAPSAIAIDGDGNAYVTGYSVSAAFLQRDYATIKYSLSGTEGWVRRHSIQNNDDWATAVKVDAGGSVHVTGASGNHYPNATDWLTIKYDVNGNIRWLGQYTAPSPYLFFSPSLALGPEGTFAVAGGSGPDYATIKYELTCPLMSLYCVAKTNSLGCLPGMDPSGNSSASSTSGFLIRCVNVRNNKPGLLVYGTTGRAALPFQGGTLCVASPTRRAVPTSAGGTPPPASDCSGVFSLDMNSFAAGLAGGNPYAALRVAGTIVNCQWWGRDPGAPFDSTLSNGLEYLVCP